jgi:hypothetical protein
MSPHTVSSIWRKRPYSDTAASHSVSTREQASAAPAAEHPSQESGSSPAVADLYRNLNRLDDSPAITGIMSGNWLAWPIVKVHLLWAVVTAAGSEGANSERGSRRLFRSLISAARDFRLALRRAPRPIGKGQILLIGVNKPVRDPEGGLQDFFFGDLPVRGAAGLPATFLSFPKTNDIGEIGPVSLAPILARARLLAKLLVPFQIPAALRLSAALTANAFPAPSVARLASYLANFHARRVIFRRVLSRIEPRLLIVAYAPGRMAEVAAAHEAGIPVIELQHGLFGIEDPDYFWSESLRAQKSRMPLPRRIGVFGDAFRQALLSGGFWDAREVVVCGCAAVDFMRRLASARREESRVQVTIFSQSLFRSELRRVLLELGALGDLDIPIDFRLVLHPEEVGGDAYYEPVRRVLAGFEIVPPGRNPLELIRESTLVIACNSLALLEACGLGCLAISVTRPDGSAGLSDIYPLQGLEDAVPHVSSGEGLRSVLVSMVRNPHDYAQRVRDLGHGLYASGWSRAIGTMIEEALSA